MAKAEDFLRAHLEAHSEAWRAEHDHAMEYWDLRARLKLSLSLFDYIRSMDEHWSEQVRSGGVSWRPDEAVAHSEFYREWLIPLKGIEESLRQLSAKGYPVEEEKQFHAAC